MTGTEGELDTEQTLSRRLSEAGYRTHLFGLQHISESPEDTGYDEMHMSWVIRSLLERWDRVVSDGTY